MAEQTSKNFHAGSRSSQDYLYDINVPTPSHAERAKTLVSREATGTLCTLSQDPKGYPYGSLVTMALSGGSPVFLISGLAEHTKNLRQDGRCSLLVTEAGEDNPLALGRVTLVGECREVTDGDMKQLKTDYFRVHPQAEYYLEFGDFSFWKLEVTSLRYIGGFGRMSWVDAPMWYEAESDPLVESAAGIINHMNEDHQDAMTAYCRAFSKAQEFTAVTMTGVDRYGFEMSVETDKGARPVRLGFEKPVETPEQVRGAMVAMVKEAREKLG